MEPEDHTGHRGSKSDAQKALNSSGEASGWGVWGFGGLGVWRVGGFGCVGASGLGLGGSRLLRV